MKKLLAIMMAAVLLVACLAGCGDDGTTLKEVQDAGKLSIATSPDFPPFEFLEGEEVKGIEIEILELICKELGVELEINQTDFESVLPGIQSGKYDVGVSGISVTEKRKKNALFTDPYCLAAQSIVVTSDSPIKSKADLDGKTVSVQTATTAEEFCMGAGYKVNAYAANSDAENALVAGKVDAWVIDDLTAAEMVAAYNEENADKPLVILSEAMTTEPYAFAMKKGSDELVEKINGILKDLIDDGTVAKIFEKYNAPYTSPNSK